MAMRGLGVAGRQKDEDIVVYGIAFQIALQRCAVNLDVLDDDGLCSGNDRGHLGLRLRRCCVTENAYPKCRDQASLRHNVQDSSRNLFNI